jgi:signal peptide peptidase SppA
MMEPGVMERMAEVFNRHLSNEKLSEEQITLAIGRNADQAHPETMGFDVQNGVAIVPIRGVIARYSSDVNGSSQPQGTSAEQIQAQLKQAEATPGVWCVLLACDSPGGTVAGTPDTAAAVADLATRMPVIAMIDELGASACYFIASQATKVYANQSALVGSIGVISRLVDSSKAAEKAGLKVHVLRSAHLKAPGQPGEVVTDAQVANGQARVDSMMSMFSAAVATGRNLSPEQMAKVTSGQVWLASEAQALGLIDGITTLPKILSDLKTNQSKITGNPMKISAKAFNDLIDANPKHAALIGKAAAADMDMVDILAQLDAAKASDVAASLSEVQSKLTVALASVETAGASLTAEKSAHTATKAELEAAKAKLLRVDKMLASAPPSVGGDSSISGDALIGEAKWRAEFNSSKDLQDQFALGGVESYVALKRHDLAHAARQ